MINQGYGFESETDTETVAKLLDYYYNGNPVETISKMIDKVEGSYALEYYSGIIRILYLRLEKKAL